MIPAEFTRAPAREYILRKNSFVVARVVARVA